MIILKKEQLIEALEGGHLVALLVPSPDTGQQATTYLKAVTVGKTIICVGVMIEEGKVTGGVTKKSILGLIGKIPMADVTAANVLDEEEIASLEKIIARSVANMSAELEDAVKNKIDEIIVLERNRGGLETVPVSKRPAVFKTFKL